MRKVSPGVLFVVVAIVLVICAGAANGEAAGEVVVELFTSEGCSSCPPADRLLAEIGSQARIDRRPVHVLSFHVDYWDRLGWKDPFSARAHSERQRAYARVAEDDRVYTPQMIVNGMDGFVGSRRAKAEEAIGRALAAEPSADVVLKRVTRHGDAVRVTYDVAGVTRGATLNVALAQDGIAVEVPRGENAGRTLTHSGVVRAFKSFPVSGDHTGETELKAPEDVVWEKARVVAYLQEDGPRRILGAAAKRLSDETGKPQD